MPGKNKTRRRRAQEKGRERKQLGESGCYCLKHAGRDRLPGQVPPAKCPTHEHCEPRWKRCAAQDCSERVWEGGCVVHRVRHPRSLGWREYVEQVAEQLRQLGRPATAARLLQCAVWAERAKCPKCLADPARVRILTSCNGRVCPFCARRASQKLTKRVSAAMELVARLVREQLPALVERCKREVSDAKARVDHWTEKAASARARYEGTGSARIADAARRALARAEKFVEKADRDRARWVRWGIAARSPAGWGWRALTLGRIWDPSSRAQRGVEPVRGRIKGLWHQWRALWVELRVGGVAAAMPRLEMSGQGYVHAHVLYFGPWASVRGRFTGAKGERTRSARKLAREAWERLGPERQKADYEARQGAWLDRLQKAVEPAAGATHVELLYGGLKGLKEQAKYTCKTISPLSPDWIAGDRRVGAHPADLAEWQIATERRQLVRHCGSMRKAMRAVIALEKGRTRDPPTCGKCKALLASSWEEVVWEPRQRTEALARALRDRWKAEGLAGATLRAVCTHEWHATVTLEGESFAKKAIGMPEATEPVLEKELESGFH